MSKNLWISLAVIAVLVLLFLGWLLYWPISDAENTVDGKKAKTEVGAKAKTEVGAKTTARSYDPDKVDAVILQKDLQIQSQGDLIVALKEQIAEKDQQIADLIKTCTGKTRYLPAKPDNNANSNSGGQDANKQSEAEYLTKQNTVPKSEVHIEINELKYCIRLGDLFWPHLAVNMGEEFSEIVDNGKGGFDLFLLPSGTIGSNEKGYGITEDFIFWIKKSRLTSWPQTPYFLNRMGIFVKAEESGEYWIAK